MGLLSLITGPVLDIVNKLIPDPAQQAEAKLALLQLQQNEEFKQIDAQLQSQAQQTDINKIEAGNVNIFVSGWRPFIGWVCGAGLAYEYMIRPLFAWLSLIVHWPVPPTLDMQTLVVMLGNLLGFGAMRTYEKVKGINSGH